MFYDFGVLSGNTESRLPRELMLRIKVSSQKERLSDILNTDSFDDYFDKSRVIL